MSAMCAVRVRFVLRGLCVALPIAALATVAAVVIARGGGLLLPADPTPPPPTVHAPPGPMPARHPGLQQWVRDDGWRLAGSGFLLAVSDRVVGVTAAHSTDAARIERAAFARPGAAFGEFLAEFDSSMGQPGVARTGSDMTVDYLMLTSERPASPPADHALRPDPRGLPQPGERVTLYAGLDGSVHDGTVQTADERAVWVLMDETFAAGLMSGSPLVSRHTGACVGMLVAGTLRRGRLLLAAHPVASLARLASAPDRIPLGGD